jgi:SSS family solute:Na+ symporter
MNAITAFGMVSVIALIAAVGLWSGRHVKNASDFLTGGGRAGMWLTCGAIQGTLVGSQMTLGTVQLAFNYGISAWWFALGSGLGCLIFGLIYTIPLRHSDCVTQFRLIAREYGMKAESLGSVLSTLGTFVSVLAQIIACTGFLTALFPSLPPAGAAAVTIILMCCYIIFGGAFGAGMGGVAKLILLCLTCASGMAFALYECGGVNELWNAIDAALTGTPLGTIQPRVGLSAIASGEDLSARFMSMTARGAAKDIGSCFSVILGLLSTQIYVQFIESARGDREARRGALLGLLLVPPVGIAGVCVGLFMRGHYITQAEADALIAAGMSLPELPVLSSTIQAFPTFIMNHMPPLLGGIALGTLFITVVSGSSGLLLGISAIVVEDLLGTFTNFVNTARKELFASRLTIILTLITATVVAGLMPAQAINDLGFLSMTLRSAVVFLPVTCALWLPGRIAPRAVLTSIALSPLAAIVCELISLPVEPLYAGIGVSALCCLVGWGVGSYTKI